MYLHQIFRKGKTGISCNWWTICYTYCHSMVIQNGQEAACTHSWYCPWMVSSCAAAWSHIALAITYQSLQRMENENTKSRHCQEEGWNSNSWPLSYEFVTPPLSPETGRGKVTEVLCLFSESFARNSRRGSPKILFCPWSHAMPFNTSIPWKYWWILKCDVYFS